MGLNRIQETSLSKETKEAIRGISDEEIKKFFRSPPQPGLPKEVSDESISAFFRGVPVAPESTALPISQGTQLTPVVGAGLKPREEDPLATVLGVASGVIPFIDEIPGVRERFEKARRIAPGAFKFGEVSGMLATGVGALGGRKIST